MHSLAVIRMHGVLNLSILTQGFTPCNPGVSRVAALKNSLGFNAWVRQKICPN